MTQQEVLNSNLTKTAKMKALFELGLTRVQVAGLMGVGYGFVQNVYAKTYGTGRLNSNRVAELVTPRNEFNFSFNRNFGIEIEAYNVDMIELKRKLNEAGIRTEAEGYNHTTRDYWKVVSDGSLTGSKTFELVSPILNGQDGLNQLQTVSRVLKSLNAKINKSCGLHVHFDADGFGIKTWRNLYKNYAKVEDSIDAFLPESRRKNNNTYCKSMKVPNYESKIDRATTLKEIERAITFENRYFKLNTQAYWRHRTVEFRQHSGTIEFEKISNWILFLTRFVEFSKENTMQDGNFESMSNFLNDELLGYFRNRKQRLAA